MSNATPYKNLVDLMARSVAEHGHRPALGTRRPEGWQWATYADVGERIDRCRAGLAALGVGAGDKVAVIADNRTEWVVGCYATVGLGACYAPMYQKQSADDWAYIVRDSGAKVLFVANEAVRAKAAPAVADIDTLEHIVTFDGEGEGSFAALLEAGAAAPVAASDPEPGTLAVLIYTSGTTGRPKGVMLSHGNLISNVNAVRGLFPMSPDDRSLAFLPWAHSFGQTCELHCGMSFGASAAICESVDKLVPYLAEIKPTLLFSVPRVFNKIYAGLNQKIASGGVVTRALFGAAMKAAGQRRALAARGASSAWVDKKHAFLDGLVFSKVRARLGGNLRYAFSGGAAISPEVATFIDNIGITVYEGYGLSETSPIATANYPGHQRIGSVGKAIAGVDILIDTGAVGGAMGDQGEILVRGPNVMMGYHNLPEQTAAVMREDGAFRTGDLGRLDDDGFLYITGRIKEQYKLENGKYVVPAPLEERLQLSPLINQALVFGDNKPHNVALIVPDAAGVAAWAADQGISPAPALDDPRLVEPIGAEIERLAEGGFKGFERVRAFRLLAEEFTVDNDMLTPTLKLKRRNVIATYQGLLDEMYGG